MTYYSNSIEIAQKLLSQQGEINALKARIDAALKLCDEFRDGRPVPPTSMAALVRAALTGEEVPRG